MLIFRQLQAWQQSGYGNNLIFKKLKKSNVCDLSKRENQTVNAYNSNIVILLYFMLGLHTKRYATFSVSLVEEDIRCPSMHYFMYVLET